MRLDSSLIALKSPIGETRASDTARDRVCWLTLRVLGEGDRWSDRPRPQERIPGRAGAEERDDALERLFSDPARAFRGTPKGFRIIALSHFAEALASEAARGELDRQRAATRLGELESLASSPWVRPAASPEGGTDTRGLYLAHRSIISLARDALAGTRSDSTTKRAIMSLRQTSLESPSGHAPSYAGSKARWPADQTAVLHALWLYDRINGTSVADEPIRRWQSAMKSRGRSPSYYDLPVSEFRGVSF